MSHNTHLHRLVRGLVKPLAVTPITPNHLTALRLLTGLAAAAAYGVGSGAAVWIGSGLFLTSMLLDRADGELARLTGQSTSYGHMFDIYTDTICDTLILVGIGVGLRGSVLGAYAIPMGIVAGIAVTYSFWRVVKFEKVNGPGSAQFSPATRFDPDDAMIIIPIAMPLGAGVPLLIAAAVCAPLTATLIHVLLRRRFAV